MDFLKLLKSFEEFVYEALSWFVLLPKTMARILLHPATMSDYAASELEKAENVRYNDAISPPLLLILCVLVAHFADLAMRSQSTDDPDTLASTLLASEQNLLLYRTLAFGLWALTGAVYLLVRRKVPLSRNSLRVPFYQQCYLVSPFALALSLGSSLILMDGYLPYLGVGFSLVGFVWLWVVQTGWIGRTTHLPVWKSTIAAASILLIGSLANAVLVRGLLTTHAEPTPAPTVQVSH